MKNVLDKIAEALGIVFGVAGRPVPAPVPVRNSNLRFRFVR